MSISRPSSPSSSPGPGLSAEDLAERELRALMSSPPPTIGVQGSGEDDVDGLDLEQSDGLAVSPVPSSTSAASIRQDLVMARRRAVQSKLHPYQRDAVEEFIKGSSMFRQILLFIQLCAVENQISSIKSTAPQFVSSPQLLENIKSFVIGVLLSSKLSAYKGAVPVDHVMAIITSTPRSYVPDNLTSDSFALKVVKSDIQEELTQCRSKIKRAIRESLQTAPKESDSIFDLATTIVANSRSSVTVPLCARLALLRKVYVESADSRYWDKVDQRLLLIRATTAGDAHRVNRVFERMLQSDRDTYGENGTYTLPDGVNDIFQNSVDLVLATGAAS